MYYTQYKGKRCALPLLADVYGFYYNKALFKEAGLKRPPKTLAGADDVREEADEEERGRLAEGRRLQPVLRLLPEHRRAPISRPWTPSGSTRTASRSSAGPGVAEAAPLAEEPDRLLRAQEPRQVAGGRGDEFSASHAFETGKLAMMIDGEWRVAFIAAEHPELKYGTAPMPVDDAKPSLYGSGYINGTIIGIPKNAQEQGRVLGARQVPDDERPRPRAVLERDPQRALDEERRQVEGAEAGRELQHVHEALRAPEVADHARSRRPGRRTSTRSRTSSPSGRPGR